MVNTNRFLIIFVFFTSALFSNCECEKEKTLLQYCNENISCGYNAPAKTFKKNYNLFIEGEALLWQPKEQGLEIALIDTANEVHPSKVLNTHFDYSSGFKISLGSEFSKQDWVVTADYTQFNANNHAKKNVDLISYTLINFWSFLNPAALRHIDSDWRLELKTFDLSFGRSYFIGKKIIFNPFFGLRNGWIDQNMEVSSIGLNHYFSKASSKSWLVGPRIGIKTNWLLGRSISFFCNGNASIFYQHFTCHFHENRDDVSMFQGKTLKKTVNPNVDILAGFDWNYSFGKNKFSILFSAAYEMQVFWNQNLMRSLLEELKNETNLQPGNLMPHGFVFSCKLSF